MPLSKNSSQAGTSFFLVVALLVFTPDAHARYLGACVSLLTKDAAIARVENPDSGGTTSPGPALSLEQAQVELGRYSLQTSVRDGVIEILPDGNANANQLARAAYILKTDPVFLTAMHPQGFKLVIDPQLQSADGYLSVEAGEIRVAANTLADHALAFATVAHEMSHAEQLSLWLKAGAVVSPINSVARGRLPGLENTRYAKHVSAQEMPATSVGRHIYQQYNGAPHPEMSAIGAKISNAYVEMTTEILAVLDGLTPRQRDTLYVTNYRTVQLKSQTVNVEYHVGSYLNLKAKNFFAAIKVLKRTPQGMVEYRLEIPLPTDTTSMSASDFLDLILSQVQTLQRQSKTFAELFTR